MKKRISLILVLCMMVTLLLPTATAAEEDPSLVIAGFNITFKDSVFLKYAVKAENAGDVRLLVWTEPQEEYTYGTQQYALTSSKQTINKEIFDVFTFKDLTAKQMTDDVYARAYTEKGGIGFYSDISKYSILDYAYSITGKTGTATTDQNLLDVISTMLAYGAAAQKYYNGGKGYHLERLATAEYYQVTVVGGTMESGFTQQLCPAGVSVVLVAPEENSEGDGFDHWENSAGESVGTTATLTITVGAANETYTAKYEPVKATKPAPSEGLDIEVDGGEALVAGLGDCEDDFVVLPEEYQSAPVTTIDAAAFAGEEFTAIYIPVTVTTIAKKAFNNAGLTTVYYEGTEAQWDEIEIGTYNDPLKNATMHYSSYGPAPATGFTVTFKDYNGTTLKTQTVKSGESATAPEDPIRDGYTFIRWDRDYTNITADTVITAEYAEGTGPMIVVSNATVAAGGTVDVPVYLLNNTGILTLEASITYDSSKLTLTGTSNGGDMGEYTFTGPKNLKSGCNASWYAVSLSSYPEGELIVLHFTSTGESGQAEISVTSGSAYDNNTSKVTVSNTPGAVSITDAIIE